jgi:hypothetical protein
VQTLVNVKDSRYDTRIATVLQDPARHWLAAQRDPAVA